MHAQPRFRLTREAALALAVSSAFSTGAGAAQIARVQFASGQVNATGADGKARPLARGAEVAVGDTVNTEQGRAQLQFSDGAVVSLQPRTAFRIDEFKFDGKADGSERSFFSLLRGGLRTVTGLVGRTNRDAYRVTTSTATIGIRGTEYLAEVGNSLRVAVGGGTITIANDAGTFVIQQGQSAYVSDSKSLPVITFDKPILPPAGTSQGTAPSEPSKEVVAGERTDVPPVPATTQFAGLGSFGLDASLFLIAGAATLNTANQATAFQESGGGQSFTKGTATVADAAFDGIVGVGRWTGGSATAVVQRNGTAQSIPFTLGPDQGLHYAIGTPTLGSPSGVSATYNLLSATQPTSADGSLGLGTLTPGAGAGQPIMAVDFTNGRVAADLGVAFSSRGYRVTTTGGLANPATSQIQLAGTVFVNTAAIPTTGTSGAACSAGATCGADVLGFLAGDNASRTAFTYEIHDGSLNIHGAATGTQASLVTVGQTPVTAGALFAWTTPMETSYRPFDSTAAGVGQVRNPGGLLVAFDGPTAGCCGPLSLVLGTATHAEGGFDGTVGFGRLASGTATIDGGEGSATLDLSATQGLHYAFGVHTSATPISGKATFALQNATRPTSSDGSLGLGTMSGGLAVDFASGKVGVDVTANFTSTVYRATTRGGISNLRDSEVGLSGASFHGFNLATTRNAGACSSGCDTNVTGFFAGANASRAGLGYVIQDNDLLQTITGAATFAQSSFAPALAGALVGINLPLNYAGAHDPIGGTSDAFVYENTAGTVDSSGALIKFNEPPFYTTTIGSAVPVDVGNDGIIGWARWKTGTLGGCCTGHSSAVLTGENSFHNVFGTPTPLTDLTALQTSTATATYSLLGATTPTSDVSGGVAGTLNSASMAVRFGPGQVDFNANVTVNATNYVIAATNLPIAGTAGSGSPVTGSTFGGSGAFTSSVACSTGCSTNVQGFFAGASAARAGAAYNIVNDLGNRVNGAVAFRKN